MRNKDKWRFDDTFRILIGGPSCIYCGEHANSREHFPPASLTRFGVILPACTECNCFAGTYWNTDFRERAEYVKQKIRSRYKKMLNVPDWSKAELDKLGYNLQTKIRAWQRQKEILRERLAWNAEIYLSQIDTGHAFAQAAAEMQAIIAFEKRKWRNYENSTTSSDSTS